MLEFWTGSPLPTPRVLQKYEATNLLYVGAWLEISQWGADLFKRSPTICWCEASKEILAKNASQIAGNGIQSFSILESHVLEIDCCHYIL